MAEEYAGRFEYKSLITVNEKGELETWLNENESIILHGLDMWFGDVIWTL